jgi:hypothetical protein
VEEDEVVAACVDVDEVAAPCVAAAVCAVVEEVESMRAVEDEDVVAACAAD